MNKAKLEAYASGSGCLSFCFVSEGMATGRTVTKKDAERWHQENKMTDFAVHVVDGMVCLARKVRRINGFILEVMDQGIYRTYRYSVDLQSAGKHSDVCKHNLTVMSLCDGELMPVINENILASIKFFINHEKQLTP